MVAVKAGTRWRSTTCETEVVVVKVTADELDLQCGGAPMVPFGTEKSAKPLPSSD